MATRTHETTAAGTLLRIPIAQVHPGLNSRGDLGDVSELAASLRQLGQQVPVIVEQTGDDEYQLFDGHRRYAAARLAGLPRLLAVVRQPLDGPARIIRQLAIESQTRAFSPMAESRALHALMFEHGLSREDIARLVGHPPVWVRDRIALVHLTESEQRAVDQGEMSVREALRRLRDRRDAAAGRPANQAKAKGGTHAEPTKPQADGVCPACKRPLSP